MQLFLITIVAEVITALAVQHSAHQSIGQRILSSGNRPQQHVLESSQDVSRTYFGGVGFPHRPSHRTSGFIALGDSYSAGIGTGTNGTEDECRRGLHAYPVLIGTDLNRTQRRNNSLPSMQFLSCTGATTADLLSGAPRSQVDLLNTSLDADFAVLSIGGNDLGFFEIMNSCIFRFYSFYSGTCEEALQRSRDALDGPEFEHRLRLVITEILDRVKWEKKPWFTIMVTGYARFFNAETPECDESSFGIWWRGPKLERKLRQRMNEMVLSVNAKIKRSVDAINSAFTDSRVHFVDYDDAFEGHRFCEPNVTEPEYRRNETWFFLVGGSDNAAGDEKPSLNGAYNDLLPPDSPLIDPRQCLERAEKSNDWGEKALCLIAQAAQTDPKLRTSQNELFAQSGMWYVPTYYGKTFHPRTLGHMAIRERIYQHWETPS